MDYKIKEVDTETWILLFLYKEDSGRSINDMAINGCRKMVFGVGLPKFQQILDKMVNEKLISTEFKMYKLEIAGLFKLKQTVYIPLLNLNSDNLDTVIEELKNSCDILILQQISGKEDERAEIIIKEKGKQCLDTILYIITKIPKILDAV